MLSTQDKQKGIYAFTTYSHLEAMVRRGWLEVAIGDAGLKIDSQGDIDSRLTKGLSNSKDPIEHKIEINIAKKRKQKKTC